MKKIGLGLLYKLIAKYLPEALAYGSALLIQYFINKHGKASYDKIIKEGGEIIYAFDELIDAAEDGVIDKGEFKKLIPAFAKAIEM